jgi:allantoin racemase
MRIMVINPNTSVSLTNHLRRELEAIKRSDTELTVTCPSVGPITIESAYDEAMAVPPTLELVRQANEQGYNGVTLACFSSPEFMQPRRFRIFWSWASKRRACMPRPWWVTSLQF